MTVKDKGQKEEEDYYPPSPQYRPNSLSQMLTSTLVTAQETAPGKKKPKEEEQNMEEDAKDNLDMDSEIDYDLDDTMDF